MLQLKLEKNIIAIIIATILMYETSILRSLCKSHLQPDLWDVTEVVCVWRSLLTCIIHNFVQRKNLS